jgi:hypothetical protein
MTTRNAARLAGIAATVIGVIVSLSARSFLQQSSSALPDVQQLGPQVGSPVPDFTLSDQRGQQRTLRSLMGPKGLMLVFSRSADW